MKISIVIPTYNEEKVIGSCLSSLSKQTIKDSEIIVVDDGSTDKTVPSVRYHISSIRKPKITLLQQSHQGPGAARNLGGSKATGEILVFVDADMEFAPDFLEKLTKPIIESKSIGTFSREEYLLNKDNIWARYWNLNLGRGAGKMHPNNYPDTQHVFRAILKSKFHEVGGFDTSIGYTDDWSLARKFNRLATVAPGAKYYHRNPDTLQEVWIQARWFGKNEFLTGDVIRKIYNLGRYCPLLALPKGMFRAIKYHQSAYIVFKLVYDTAVFTSVLLSFFGEEKSK